MTPLRPQCIDILNKFNTNAHIYNTKGELGQETPKVYGPHSCRVRIFILRNKSMHGGAGAVGIRYIV